MPSSRDDISKGNIMVVDDKPENLKLLIESLQTEGYKVRPVAEGKMAVTGAKRVPPEIILLDINMPGMDGYEVCEALKADEELADIPVIFVSALGETIDKVKAFSVGGVDYITKPFQIEEVLARLETHLTIHRLQREREELIANLEKALADVKTLSGLMPICAGCKKIRDDQGYWTQIETYIKTHSDAEFSHGICPECTKKHYPDLG